MRIRTASLVLASALVATFGVTAFAAVTLADQSGEQIFVKYCAACHGVSGRGDGPVARKLIAPVPDLTDITRRYGGFPTMLIREAIDGRADDIDAHGTRTMPVWGYEFWLEEGGDDVAERGMDEAIAKLVDYLRQIQVDSIAENGKRSPDDNRTLRGNIGTSPNGAVARLR